MIPQPRPLARTHPDAVIESRPASGRGRRNAAMVEHRDANRLPMSKIVQVASVSLDEGAPLLREPSRPAAYRDETFEARFDRHTLVYDAIRSPETGQVRIVAPALLNLLPEIQSGHFRQAGAEDDIPFSVRSLDRQTQILLEGPANSRHLTLDCSLGRFPIKPNDEQFDLFRDQRVVFTLSKNNRLEWIADWVRFYRDVHGATAVLIFDNASTAYTAQQLLETIAAIEGIKVAVVVEWPFRHGPPGIGSYQYWDSNFSQLGAFEVARWRFLGKARSVLNCDIDELVVSRSGASIFEAVERSLTGVVSFFGDWVVGLDDITPTPDGTAPIRFRDFTHVVTPKRGFRHGIIPYSPTRCRPKWALVPTRCPAGAQWHIHTIAKWLPARVVGRRFQFRHFREINFNWKYDRLGRERFDPERFHVDPLMQAAFARVKWADRGGERS